MRKKQKNRWRFLCSMPVNHSNYQGNHTIQQLPPMPQSRFLSPPAPLTSSCHYISFEILLMKKKWVISSCQHRPKPHQASQSFLVNPLGTGRRPVAPPATTSTLLGNNASEQDQQPLENYIRDERSNVLGGAGTEAWDSKHKLPVWTELKR